MDVEVLSKLNLIDKEDLIKVKKNGDPMKFVVTGGCGHVGFNLAKSLYKLGGKVVLADIRLPADIEEELTEDLTFIKADITLYSEVVEAFTSADCVFHVASVGITTAEQLDKKFTNKINVGGTRNVIRACVQCGVTKLIYLSSYNVAFGYEPIINGDDFVPYSDPKKLFSYYSISKQQADKDVMAANMTEVKGGKLLKTCCFRPPGIVGPDERTHMDRMTKDTKRGVLYYDGYDGALMDWIHIDNLVQANILAIAGLGRSTNYIAAGKAYFICDEDPMTMLKFARPFVEGLGLSTSTIKVPSVLFYVMGYAFETLYWILKPIYNYHPQTTRSDVLCCIVTDYHSISRVRNELGFNPRKYSWDTLVKNYLKECHPNIKKKSKVNPNRSLRLMYPMIVAVVLFLIFCYV